MSWGFTAGGKGAEASAKLRAQAEASKQYNSSEGHAKLVDGVAALGEAFAAAFPEKTIVLESNGHVDSSGGFGNASFAAKVYN